MSKTQTRQSKRTPVTLKIKFKSATLGQFIERYAIDVSQGGIFIRTKDPLPVGTTLRFEFQLRDASPLIAGEGTVVWIREHSPSQGGVAPGMGVRFDRLTDSSQTVLDEILSQKAGRGSGEDEEPFTEQPTRVAPSPLVDDLAKESKQRRSQQGPDAVLRRSMIGGQAAGGQEAKPRKPFQTDADEFSEDAFEQATRVRSLEDLAAASAQLDGAEVQQLAAEAAGTAAPEPDAATDAAPAADAAPGAEGSDMAEAAADHEAAAVSEPDGGDEDADEAGAMPEDEEPLPSQTDDRAQTSIFPSKRRLRPMLSLDAALGRTGPGAAGKARRSTPDDALVDAERTRPRVSPTDEPELPDAALTHERSARESSEEPTRESLLAVKPVLPAGPPSQPPGDAAAAGGASAGAPDEAPAAKQSPDEDAAAASKAKAQGQADGGATAELFASDDGAEEEEDDDSLTQLIDKPQSPAAASAAEKDGDEDGDSGSDTGDEDEEENLTHIMDKPRAQSAGSGARAGVAVAVLLAGLLGAGGYFLFLRGDGAAGGGAQVAAPATEEDAAAPGAEEAAEAVAQAADADDVAEETVEVADEPPPPIETAAIEVQSTPKGAMAELVDGAQEGPTPMTFELDESKTHRIRISHPGYVRQEITIDPAGSPPEPVTLEPAPWLFRLSSTPEGAVVYINGRRVDGTTPNEMVLPPGWEKKRRFKVSFRLAGHEKLDIFVGNDFEAEPEAMVQTVEGTMVEETEPAAAARREAEDETKDGPEDGDDTSASQDQATSEGGDGGEEAAAQSGGAGDSGQDADDSAGQTGAAAEPPAAQQPAPSGGTPEGAGSASTSEP